jgi:hypothetical protein
MGGEGKGKGRVATAACCAAWPLLQENSDLLEDTEWAITRIQGAVMSATSS